MIPKHIILTWKDRSIPQAIVDRWKTLNPTYTILFFTDEDIIHFLNTHYGIGYSDFFRRIPFGRYKADFFRYCYLYQCGGFYVDIDIEPVCSIDEVIPESFSFLTIVSCNFLRQIYQAVLFSEAKHPILNKCIASMFFYGSNIGIDPPDIYPYKGHPTVCMYENICKYLNKDSLQEGVYGSIVFGTEYPIGERDGTFIQGKMFAYNRYLNYNRDHGFLK
jgi:mannosyltransferase OCH1-like enzyme